MRKSLFLLIFILITTGLYSQERDISALLKSIDSGDIKSAQAGLKKLNASHPDDPSVIYLNAVLTSDGKEALSGYQKVAESFPQSRYADAALFRLYSYYYASGLYNTAQKYYDRLQEDYPSSVYLKQHEIIKDDYADVEEINNTPPVTPGIKEKSEPEKVFKYTIQTGAFLVLSNAQNLKNTFEKSGYYSEVKEKKVGGSTFSIVYLGRFETEEEAKTFLTDLNKRQKIEGRVVHIE